MTLKCKWLNGDIDHAYFSTYTLRTMEAGVIKSEVRDYNLDMATPSAKPNALFVGDTDDQQDTRRRIGKLDHA